MSEQATSGGGLARLLLWGLVLLPLGFVPRLFGEPTPEPLDLRPAWMHLVVVTVGRWESGPAGPELDALRRRSAVHPQLYATSHATGPSAASLWTGRWPRGLGLRSNADGLPVEAWSLARAAQDSGAITAALLEEPFVSGTRIPGFAHVLEAPELSDATLLDAAERHFASHPEARKLLWLHVRESGPGGERVEPLLAGLHDLFQRMGVEHDTMLLLTAFGRELAEPGDGAFRVPFFASLPTGLFAGRRGAGAASQVDLVGDVLLELMRLPPPNEAQGGLPLQSRPQTLGPALKGGGKYGWLLLEGTERTVLRSGKLRGDLAPTQGVEPRFFFSDDPTRDNAQAFRALPPERAQQARTQMFQVLQLANQDAPTPMPAHVGSTFQPLPGWGD